MTIVYEGLVAFALVTVAMIVVVLVDPRLTASRSGRMLVFVAFFVLPVLITWAGTSTQLEHSKSTQFCLSCHVMAPWGRSLHIDDQSYLPAAHVQNHRVPPERACYTCHTTYTLFGPLRSKLRGFRHLYINYLGTTPKTIKLFNPDMNPECLHCHGGARDFESRSEHQAVRQDLNTDQVSCLDCHGPAHGIDQLDRLKMWKGSTS